MSPAPLSCPPFQFPAFRLCRASLIAVLAVAAFLGAPLLPGGAVANAQNRIPTPESVLGFRVGADFELAT